MSLKISEFPQVVSPQALDKLPLVRGTGAGADKWIYYEALIAGVLPNSPTFSGTVTAAAFVGSGIGLTGIASGTGGVINTGSTTIGADSDVNGVGVIDLQTRNITRLRVNNDGTVTVFGTTLTIGDVGVSSSARIDLTIRPVNTATTGRLWNWSSQGFALTNGPGGETNYDDDTMALGYNNTFSGTKIVAGLVNFGWSHEARWYNGADFQTEVYFAWSSPDGLISFRPFSFDIDHATALTVFGLQGEINFVRDVSAGGAQWALLNRNDSGGINLDIRPASYVAFANNNSAGGIRFLNSIAISQSLGYLDSADVWQIAPNGGDVNIPGLVTTGMIDSGYFRIAGQPTTHIRSIFTGYLDFYSAGVEVFRTHGSGASVFGSLFLTDGTVKEVVFGAADSGGAGYKLVRVLN